jgi:aldose 1-epimerase
LNATTERENTDMGIDTFSLENDFQRLELAPSLGAAITAWEWKTAGGGAPLLRPWNRKTPDRYTTACFPLIPWSNRITAGGFEVDGKHYPVKPNREGEAYPIHGDGWLQPWTVEGRTHDRVTLTLESDRFDDNPYTYRGVMHIALLDDGMTIDLSATHLGEAPLPYGLGLHPYFPRDGRTRLRARADGVWLSGDDPIPVRHTSEFPAGWDYNQPSPLDGDLIDNGFSGWDGEALIEWPDRKLSLRMTMLPNSGFSLLFRPPGQAYFCFEPITHPIDAFHMPGRPGMAMLKRGDTVGFSTRFCVGSMPV